MDLNLITFREKTKILLTTCLMKLINFVLERVLNKYYEFNNKMTETINEDFLFHYFLMSFKIMVIISLLAICVITVLLTKSLYKFSQGKKNRKKLILLCISIFALTLSYGIREFLPMQNFDKYEIILRDFLFFVCFYFFFADLMSLDGRKIFFYANIIILILISILSSLDLIL